MKRLLFFLYLLCTCWGGIWLPLRAENRSLEKILQELDYTIRQQDRYIREKEQQVDSLKLRLQRADSNRERYELCGRLFQAYNKYQMDSALYYVDQKELLLHADPHLGNPEDVYLNRAEIMSIMGMYRESLQALEKIDRAGLDTPSRLSQYYTRYRAVYGYMADYSLTKPEQTEYVWQMEAYRDSLIDLYTRTGDRTYKLVVSDRELVEKHYREALQEVLALYNDPQVEPRLKGMLAYEVGEAYGRLNDEDTHLYYMALSAILDIRMAIREYTALPRLALIMYERGDIGRAYRYLTCSMRDAVSCNARLRTIEATRIYPIIDEAYRLKERRSNRIQTALLVTSLILSAFLVLGIFYTKKQMRKLAEARRALSEMNRQLSAANDELSQLNQTKQQYLAYYLDQCTMYLDKLEDYRLSLQKLALASKINELFKAIKSERFIEDERVRFYKSFDETFLKLYPRFVEQFNDLLADGEKIYPKPGELLCTEIRIFALIRLGISDSNKIARFLRYSLNTIYAYRSKVRNKAKGDKNDFERQVMEIRE